MASELNKISRGKFLTGAGAALALSLLNPAAEVARARPANFTHGIFNDEIFRAWWYGTDMGKAIDSATSRYGVKPQVVHFYGSWWSPYGQEFWPGKHLDAIASRGCQPLYTWQPDAMGYKDDSNITPWHIASGWWDGAIREFAQRSRAWGKELWVRIFHEANLRNAGQYVWQEGSPEGVIAAHRRIVDIFREEGANNVKWVWNPSADKRYSSLRAVYPGHDYVDFGGFDHYGNPDWNGGYWSSFTEQVWTPYQHIRRLTGGKPMVLGEIGQVEGREGWKGEWIRKTYQGEIPAYFPLVKSVCYFDAQYWPLSSSPSALEGYKKGVKSVVAG